MVLTIVLSVVFAVILLLTAIEVHGWTNGSKQLSRQQKGYRIAAALMMETLLLMILFRNQVIALHRPWIELGYWGIALLLSFMLVVVALLDVKQGLNSYAANHKEIVKELIKEDWHDK